jgi:ABC-type branched-subunit amino acid transport system substrate-binding protein
MLVGIIGGALALILVITTAVILFGSDEKKPQPKEPVAAPACGYKIAYLGILTGENNGDGETIRNATRMALDRHNRTYGSCTTELVEYDTKGDEEEAARLADQLAKDPKILGVIGPVWEEEALRVMPILDAAGVAAVSPSLYNPLLSGKGWKTFHRTAGTDADQAAAAARYFTNVFRSQKVYIVAANDEHGLAAGDAMRRGLPNSPAWRANIEGTEPSYNFVIDQIVYLNADAVYISAYSAAAGIFMKDLRARRPNVKVIAWDRIFTSTFLDGAGAAAEGVVLTCPCWPPAETRNNFGNEFRDRFNATGYYGPEAYDAANVLLSAIGAGKATRADVLAYVSAYDAEGVSRRIKFTENGDLDPSSPTVWTYQVKNGTIVKDQLMPTS